MRSFRTIFLLLGVALSLTHCAWYDNQTTYFNTFYNMQRIMNEVEDEFSYQDENKRIKPRVLVPSFTGTEVKKDPNAPNSPAFLREFIIERSKLQPVNVKVDSILIKGSKILANHPKSRYVEGTLFLMAKAYFYRNEWVPSQVKCVEMIEQFSDGDLSPDAHLLLAKNYLIQRKMSQGLTMLSKTVDVAWYKDRYDILSQAYRIQAELALENGDLEKAVQPYKQAVAQCEDNEQSARWQVDVASIYYRRGADSQAIAAYEKVFTYTPDVLAQFESKLYTAAAHVHLGHYDQAELIFKELEDNRNFTEWTSFIVAERMAMDRARKENVNDPTIIAQEKRADTAFVGRPELMAQAFQKGMKLYKQGKYSEALPYFAKAKVVRTPVYDVAAKYFNLIKQWEDEHRKILGYERVIMERETMRDTIAIMKSASRFSLGRVHEQMGNADSSVYYYKLAFDSTAVSDQARSRYLYAQARMLRESDPEVADSLLEVLSRDFPKSDFGKEAQSSLGYVGDLQADDASELYRSANSFRAIKDYAYATRQYMAIVTNFPTNELAPKALYALGYMHERNLDQPDSARYYYGLLVEKYPRSEYAKEVRPSLEFALAKLNGAEVSDSLLLNDLDAERAKKAKENELDPLQQLINNNKDALQVTAPGVNVPGMPPGTSVNDMLKGQLDKLKGGLPTTPGGPAITPPTQPVPNPSDTTSPKKP